MSSTGSTSMSMSSTSTMSGMPMGSPTSSSMPMTPAAMMGMDPMAMTFFTSATTPLFSMSWVPSTAGQYTGTCIFLILFAAIFRALLAVRIHFYPLLTLADIHRNGGLKYESCQDEILVSHRWRAREAVLIGFMDVVLAAVGYLLFVLSSKSVRSPLETWRLKMKESKSKEDVALVANFAENLTEEVSGPALVKYILIFTPAWHAWSDVKEISNAYFNDDIGQRAIALWLMALLIIYGNNAIVVEDISALRTTVGVYLLARLTCISCYAVYSLASHAHRYQNRIYAGLTFLGLFLWIPLFFEGISLRAKVAVAVVAMVTEEVVWMFSFGPWVKRLLKLTYSTAVNIPHEVDRAGAFYTIVLGEFLYGIVVSSPAGIGLTIAAMRAIWTLVIAFCLNWLYDSADGSIDRTHPLRRSVATAYIWMLIHLPLNAGLLIGGHICAYSVAEDELSQGLRWLWGGGLGLGMLVLWIIAMCFRSEDPPGRLLMPKNVRLAPRLVVTIIFVLLPLASEERLSPTDLLSIGAGLFVFVLLWETVTSLEKGACTFESWRNPEAPASHELREKRPNCISEVVPENGIQEKN